MTPTLDFLFVGTAKAGTTSLHRYLEQHPDIIIPVKETFFYMRDIYKSNELPYPYQRQKQELITDINEFKSLYPENETRLKGEIGTGYLYYHETSIPLIREHLGENGKILIVLRHPTDRCYSSYMHFVKDLHETETFERSLEKEAERIEKGWDFMWHHKALSLYASQVEAYVKNFKHVKVLIYEEFIKDPEETLEEILNFLEVDAEFSAENIKRYNPSGEPRFKAIQRMVTQENPIKSALRPVFRRVFDKEKREKIRKGLKNRNLKKAESISESTRKELDKYFEKDINRLEEVIGRKIDSWKR